MPSSISAGAKKSRGGSKGKGRSAKGQRGGAKKSRAGKKSQHKHPKRK
jgi:hypothetical protein